VKKAPYLINEMINIEAQLVAMGHAGRCNEAFFSSLLNKNHIDMFFYLLYSSEKSSTT
jgi:hypothetical protein